MTDAIEKDIVVVDVNDWLVPTAMPGLQRSRRMLDTSNSFRKPGGRHGRISGDYGRSRKTHYTNFVSFSIPPTCKMKGWWVCRREIKNLLLCRSGIKQLIYPLHVM